MCVYLCMCVHMWVCERGKEKERDGSKYDKMFINAGGEYTDVCYNTLQILCFFETFNNRWGKAAHKFQLC